MSLIIANEATPATPSSGFTELFVNTSKRASQVTDAGTVTVLTGNDTSDVLSNKSINDTCKLVNAADNSKIIQPSLGGMAAGITLTLASAQTSTQQLNIPDIPGTAALLTTPLLAGTTSVPPFSYASTGSLLTSPAVGANEFNGTAYFQTVDTTSGRAQTDNFQIFRLTADGSAIGAGIADFFGTNSAFPTVLNGVYEIVYYIKYLKTTAGTVTYTITHTQTYTNSVFSYIQSAVGGITPNAATTGAGLHGNTTAAAVLPATASLTTLVDHFAIIYCLLECGTAGNVRLRVTESAGTVTPRRGSFYTAKRLFAGNVGTFVA